MKALSRFIVKVADLAEAEGRVLRREVITIGIILVLALGSVLVGVAGAVMLILSMYIGLEKELGGALAAAICGLVLLACAGAMVWLVNSKLAR